MQINLSEPKILELTPSMSEQDIENRVSDQRIDAFGLGARLMQRPKPSEIVISRRQKRYETFWYGIARAVYTYDRRRSQQVAVAQEVQSVTVHGEQHPVKRERGTGYFTLDTLEHCTEETRKYLMLDGESGEERDYSRYLAFSTRPVDDLQAFQASEDYDVIAPEVRSSFVAGKLIQMAMRSVQADAVHEEQIDLEHLVLYLRPVHAFEYHWTTRDRRVVVEFDPLLGTFRTEGGQFKQQLRKVLANDALFDIGADAIGTVVPGANLAVKLGRLAARKVVD